MANEKFTQLPTVVSSTLADIIAAVQAGTSVQQTLGQVFTLMQANLIQNFAGNPNGNVAGTTYGLCWDRTNNILYVCTTSGNAATAVWTIASGIATPVTMANGGSGKALTASAGGIVWTDADSMEILAGVAAAGKMLQSGNLATPSWSTPTWPSASGAAGKIIRADGTNNVYSTATFADTYAVSTILYASSADTVTGLATANNGVLITSAGGVPSISSTLPSAVQDNITRLGAQAIALNMNSNLINNVSTPVSGTDAANKNYVDQTALNGTSVYAATAAGLTVTQAGAGPGATLTNAGAMAAFSIDGVSPPAGVNVLVKDIAAGGTAANYGIYTVTDVGSGASNWVLTRATSFDTATEINNTGLIVINNGSTLAGKAWYNTATIVTVDTTNFVFVQFASQTLTVAQQIFTASGTYTPTAGMTYCIIEAVGGGGGSAGTSSASGANSAAGGGGGAAGYSKGVYTLAQIKGAGTVAAITVGTGGAGGAAGNNSGSPGNATTVIANNGAGATLMTCNGGNGGSFMASTSGSDRTNGGSGGTASGGSLNVTGNAGWPGLVISGVSIPAYGGASYYGGVSRPVFNSAGVAATGYGSGGTGGWDQGVGTDLAGAAGSDGVVYITEYIAT